MTGGRRGLTRDAIVGRALEIGDREGLEAVSLRRIASDLGVTPMALYRHVRDKNDLLNAMLEAVMAGVDLTAGIEPAMPWQQQVRRGLQNAVAFLTARPVTLPLQIAYQGPVTATIARPLEASLDILLRAGFGPRDAVALARMLPILLAGVLLLYRMDPSGPAAGEQRDRLLRHVELQLLDLPADAFPNLRRHAGLVGETVFPDTDRWLRQAIDLIVGGLEATLDRQPLGDAARPGGRAGGNSADPTGPAGDLRWTWTMAEHWTQPGPPADASGYLDALARVAFQSGISWRVVEAKWPGTRAAFQGFDPGRVAAFDAADIDRLMGDTRVIRNRKKLEAVVANARLMRDLAREHGGFGRYLDSLGDFEATRTELKKRFAFVGDSGAWWFLWAVGRPVPEHEHH